MRRSAISLLLTSLLLLLSLPALANGPRERPGPPDQGRVWERFERTLPIQVEAANPFDPDEVDVFAEFRAPDASVSRTIGFVYRPYRRELLENGSEQLTPLGPLEWRVRFTPTRRGRWQWRWVRRTANGDESGAWHALQVLPNRDPRRHGFLRRSEEDPRYLRFDDGAGFFSVGTNLGWSGRGGSFDFEHWMDRYAEQGANVIRVWMPRWDTGLFYAPAQLEDWRERMDRAWRLDQVFAMGEARGIHIMLVLLIHGTFSLDFNSGWHLNPFNAALGGPLEEPLDVWTDPEGRRILRNLFRYVVARWGYATNLLCWELWNEANLTAPAGPIGGPVDVPIDDLVTWHREMGRVLRDADPNDHLVSTSSSDGVEVLLGPVVPPSFHTLQPVYALPEIDFAQLHLYQLVPASFPPLFKAVVPTRGEAAGGRPVLVAEAGVDADGPGETLAADPEGEGLHDLIWSGLVAGAFGSGMPWWWDNLIDPENRYFHWGPVAELTRGVDFHLEGFEIVELPVEGGPRDVRAYVLQGKRTLLAWIKNHDHEFFHPDRGTLTGARVELPGLERGRWRLRWIDTWTGEELERRVVRSAGDGSPLELVVPDFSRDVALRIDRLRGSPR